MKLLFFAGSTRRQSFNAKLAALAHRIAEANGLEATLISLADYPMPIYDGDVEIERGPPASAERLKVLMLDHAGIFIASPEYNASVTPLLKNTIDWLSRKVGGDGPAKLFMHRPFAISSASPSQFGGIRGLLAVRQVLAVGLNATVLGQQLAVTNAGEAFDSDGTLKGEPQRKMLTAVVEALAEAARKSAA